VDALLGLIDEPVQASAEAHHLVDAKLRMEDSPPEGKREIGHIV
jgi:hypothetical protein